MFYILLFWMSVRERERKRQAITTDSHMYQNRKEEIKSGASGCGSFVVPYCQPAASTHRLHC